MQQINMTELDNSSDYIPKDSFSPFNCDSNHDYGALHMESFLYVEYDPYLRIIIRELC